MLEGGGMKEPTTINHTTREGKVEESQKKNAGAPDVFFVITTFSAHTHNVLTGVRIRGRHTEGFLRLRPPYPLPTPHAVLAFDF